ncbi:hypothetical protein M427DRAFT_130981 [Gonapodya prolifera JEL478]|uniref:Amino acid transporter transmembrane domain-containing protein n=1 Tax=Gonapodya prolifera (strain JEL478) TaxID=1344416 RepID=A0A139AVK8_GONPJ|nr:hypothetical protein M427DRAFT_130981 [Gonapodya prolifera JEL478]|eukprot:KXS20771.1 hypothetical protein M427DRAFT_130981 [Gonapodya prolifera JEL478]
MVQEARTTSDDTHRSVREESMGGATVFSSTLNLTKTILGAGMLSLPYALTKTGIVLGLLVLISSSLLTIWTLRLYVYCARYLPLLSSEGAVSKKVSWDNVCQLTGLHPAIGEVVSLNVVVSCLGMCIAYFVAIGDFLPAFLVGVGVDSDSFIAQRMVCVTAAAMVLTPLSLLRTLDSLRVFSLLGNIAVGYLVAMACWSLWSRWLDGTLPDTGDLQEWKWSPDLLYTFSLATMGFSCHQNIFSIYAELPDNQSTTTVISVPKSSSELVISLSLGIATVIYCLFATVGYVTFGDDVQSNFLNNYPPKSMPALIARIVLVVILMASFLVQFHPCKTSAISIVSRLLERMKRPNNSTDSQQLDGDDEPSEDASLIPQHVKGGSVDEQQLLRGAVSIGLLVLAYLIAATVKDLSLVLALTGATGVTLMASVLPFVFVASAGRLLSDAGYDVPHMPKWKRTVFWVLAALGVALIVWSVKVIL